MQFVKPAILTQIHNATQVHKPEMRNVLFEREQLFVEAGNDQADGLAPRIHRHAAQIKRVPQMRAAPLRVWQVIAMAQHPHIRRIGRNIRQNPVILGHHSGHDLIELFVPHHVLRAHPIGPGMQQIGQPAIGKDIVAPARQHHHRRPAFAKRGAILGHLGHGPHQMPRPAERAHRDAVMRAQMINRIGQQQRILKPAIPFIHDDVAIIVRRHRQLVTHPAPCSRDTVGPANHPTSVGALGHDVLILGPQGERCAKRLIGCRCGLVHLAQHLVERGQIQLLRGAVNPASERVDICHEGGSRSSSQVARDHRHLSRTTLARGAQRANPATVKLA